MVWRSARIVVSVLIAIQLAAYTTGVRQDGPSLAGTVGRVQWLLDLNRRNGRPVVIRIEDRPFARWVPANGRSPWSFTGR
jgi:hypothetical protein